MITITYLESQCLISSTRVRRKNVMLSYQFFCKCNRCVQTIDLSRTMCCPTCNRNTVVWGLSLDGDSLDYESATAASCILCKSSHPRSLLPLDEEIYLEEEVETLQNTVSLFPQRIHDLQARILDTLGGNHWTAAATMVLRYDNDPMRNGFLILQWGEAYAEWLKLAVPDVPHLYYLRLCAVGSGCTPQLIHSHRQEKVMYAGIKYWNECYEYCKKFLGDDDEDVRNMNLMFARCCAAGSKLDVIVCSYNQCQRPIEDHLDHDDTKQRCAACGLARYCNKTCQRQDWKVHKVVCSACQSLRDLRKVNEWVQAHHGFFGIVKRRA